MQVIKEPWQLEIPVNAITFDCDGTLSTIEGIDELANMNGAGARVQQLTETAMAKSGLNAQLYQHRLSLVRPTRTQILTLGQQYFMHKSAEVVEVIQLLQQLKKEVYILSAGLYPAVSIFGKLLNIPENNIFAVNIDFDQAGNYVDFDHTSPLITDAGKKIIGARLKAKHARMIHIGDGLNDYSINDLVVRFIGYGGVFYRERIAKLCQYYITSSSMAAILPLCLTRSETQQLTEPQAALYHKGRLMLGEINAASF